MSQKERSKAWRRVIGATRRKINLAWWLEMLAPISIGFGILAASALLYLRTQTWFAEHMTTALIATGATVVILPILALILGKSRFVNQKQAAVRLESVMGLNNALSVAGEDMGPWPQPPMKPLVRDGFGWNWRRLVLPPMLAAALVAAAFLLPVKPLEAKVAVPNEPIAWQEMEGWLEELKEEEVSPEEKIEELMEQIENLRSQPEEEWFSHSSLEATDSLREGLERALGDLQNDYTAAERSLTALEKYSSALSESAQNQLMEEFQNAIKGMELSKLPPDQKLMEALKKLQNNPQGLKQMTPEQMQQLQQAMQKNGECLNQMMGNCQKPGGAGWGSDFENEEALMRMIHGENWRQTMRPGQGGINRGRGDAPMFHNEDESQLGSNDLEGVNNEDYSRAAPGDVIGIGEAENNIEEMDVKVREAGAIGSTGQGGETVWEENLLPSERAVLERYFK